MTDERTNSHERARPVYTRGDGWVCYRAADFTDAAAQAAPLRIGEFVYLSEQIHGRATNQSR
jgi:hypothetical protein